MAFKDVIKFENSFVSQGGISPATGTLNGTYEAGKIGQGYRSFRTGGALTYTPSDFGIDLNSNRWGFIAWAKPNVTSLDTVAERHDFMNIGSYYIAGQTDIYMGFHGSTPGQRDFQTGNVYQNQVGKSSLNAYTFDDWTVQNWFLYGIWCDGTQFGRMLWDPVNGLSTSARSISWDSTDTYPFQDLLIVSGYGWDNDGWGGSVDELRIYDSPFTQKEFMDLAKAKAIHYTFNTDQQTIENEFYDNWDDLVINYGYGPGTLQSGATDPFGSTDSSVYRKTGKLRFGVSDGTDIGTLYAGTEYTFSIYLRHVYNEEKMGAGEFDISDQTGKRSFSGSLGDNMSYVWKRFWCTASPTNASYHFIDIGTYLGGNVFEWCCPQIEQRVRYASDGLEYYQDVDLNVSKYTTGRTGIINDDSGNGNDVTLTYANSPYWNGDASDGRKTSLFPGVNTKKIVLDVDNSTNLDTFTWACWAWQLDTSTQHSTPITVSQYIMSQGRDTGIYGVNIYTPNATGNVYGRYYGSGGLDTLIGGNILDGWHHIALTYDISVGGKLYVDGDLVDSGGPVGNINYNNYDFVVGKMAHGHTGTTTYFPFNGYIDDVRVYGSALDAADIKEVMQQKGSIDSVGNFSTGDLQETGHNPLLIDYTEWTLGSGGTTNFPQNGETDENERILTTDPWGNNDAIVWECRPNTVATGAGGWNTSQFDIDNSSFYRYSHWVQRNEIIGSTHGAQYLGLNGYGTVDGVYNRTDGVNNTNPYFISSYTAPLPGRWELVVGHVWPVGSGTGSNHPESGRYTPGGYFSTSQYVRDYVWRSETTTANQRSYLYYSAIDVSMRQQFLYPRVDKIDGTEPSIEDLLGGFDAAHIDYIRQKGGTEPVSLDVGFSETHVGKLSEIGIADELLAWWPLQGSYTPSGEAYEMVSGLDGTITGDPSITSRGYDFPVTTERVYSNLNSFIEDTSRGFSFSGWSNRTSNDNAYNMPYGQDLNYMAHRSTDNFTFSCRVDGVQRSITTPDTSWGNDEWVHTLGTYDGDKLRVYVNGELKGTSASYPGGMTWNTGYQFAMGDGRNTGTWYPFNGKISDVRIYNKALDAAEAEILYKTTDPESTNTVKLTNDTIYLKGEVIES